MGAGYDRQAGSIRTNDVRTLTGRTAGGSPMAAGDASGPCGNCLDEHSPLDGVRSYGFYAGPLGIAVQQFKYSGLHCLAGPLAELMRKGWEWLAPAGVEFDLVVPVPLHFRRERERGYNQSALLARELGVHLRCPVARDALVRTRATASQTSLNAKDRRVNVRGAFQCVKGDLRGARVLLVDDVYTTGSTTEAACLALRDAGVEGIWVYTLARARFAGQDLPDMAVLRGGSHPAPSPGLSGTEEKKSQGAPWWFGGNSMRRSVEHGADDQRKEYGGDRSAAGLCGEKDRPVGSLSAHDQ
jgi:ComF family protein